MGWGIGYGRFAPVSSYPMKWVWGTWSAGIQWKYYGKVRYIGAVAAELEFLQRAYQEQVSLDSEDYTRRMYNTVNLPLIWHIHMNFNDNRLRIFLNAGVWASYNISAYEWVKSGSTVSEGRYRMKLVRDNPLGYGLLGGIGLNVVMGKWELMIEGRYYFSYGDVLRNRAVYAGNPVRSPLDNISLSLGFYYRLGDRPHTPEPPPWYARIIAKREAKRAMQQMEAEKTAGEGSPAPDAAGETGAEDALSEMPAEQSEANDDSSETDEEGTETTAPPRTNAEGTVSGTDGNNTAAAGAVAANIKDETTENRHGNDETEQGSQTDTEGHQ